MLHIADLRYEHGFVRGICRENKMEDLQRDIVHAIESWYRVTYIHILKRNDGSHWRMALHHLL